MNVVVTKSKDGVERHASTLALAETSVWVPAESVNGELDDRTAQGDEGTGAGITGLRPQHLFGAAVTTRPAAGLSRLQRARLATVRPAQLGWMWTVRRVWLREVLIIAALYVACEAIRSLSDVSAVTANGHAEAILRWERALHADPEHGLNDALARVPALGVASSYFYTTLHYLVTPAVLIFLYRRHGAHYRSARRTLALATAGGLVIFGFFPTTPPRLMRGTGFHDTMADSQNWGWWSGAASAPRGLGGLTDQLAAMPSLHVAWALWSGIVIGRFARPRWLRVVGLAYPAATTLVVVATANHYLLDAVAGALLLAVAFGVVRGLDAHVEDRS